MKNIIKNLTLLVCVTAFISSCETIDYGDTNDNPSGPIAPVTSQLLTSAQASMPGIQTSVTGTLYMQHITQGQYPGSSRYETLSASYNGWYTGPMQNLNEIIKLNEDSGTAGGAAAFGANENQIAVSKIIRAYYLHYMTDRWGYLPWTDAFKGIDQPQPAFDSQESIYNFMFAEIDAALAMMSNGAGPQGDVLFDGDMDQWAAFGNNLKARMAMRISDVNPTLAQSKFEQAVASGMLVTDNADNIEWHYGSDETSDSAWEDRFQTREDYILSRTMIDWQRTNMDPRMFEYAEEARDSVSAVTNFPGGIDAGYVGAPNGAVNGNVPSYSFITSDIIYDKQFPSVIFDAAETHFKMAEAAMKGWNVGGGTAAAHYDMGVMASMDYWGVDSADAAAYLAAHPYAGIAEIAYEKWVALYLQGHEAWSEWRRLDLPVLTPSAFASTAQIPTRDGYDAAIETNNPANYAAVVAAQGPDNIYTKLWWDVN